MARTPLLRLNPRWGQTIARNTIQAGEVNNGNPRDWAENAVAGVNAALAGFGAVGKVPEGVGALYGVGAAMREQQANRQETSQGQDRAGISASSKSTFEKTRAQNEQTNFDKDYDLSQSGGGPPPTPSESSGNVGTRCPASPDGRFPQAQQFRLDAPGPNSFAKGKSTAKML